MKFIGMLDSPYLRCAAISLQLLGLRFEYQSLSVFRTFSEFQKINPVVKAPTLVCDDSEVLMDSTLILEYAQAIARPRTLMLAARSELQHTLRVVGLARAACEKAVQIIYERGLRCNRRSTRSPSSRSQQRCNQAGVSVASHESSRSKCCQRSWTWTWPTIHACSTFETEPKLIPSSRQRRTVTARIALAVNMF